MMSIMDQVPAEKQGRLEDKWWERHFRGFEAGLPIKLICNLQPLFTIKDEDEVTKIQQSEKDKSIDIDDYDSGLIEAFGQDDESLPEHIRQSIKDRVTTSQKSRSGSSHSKKSEPMNMLD